jgi:hypothetical protein
MRPIIPPSISTLTSISPFPLSLPLKMTYGTGCSSPSVPDVDLAFLFLASEIKSSSRFKFSTTLRSSIIVSNSARAKERRPAVMPVCMAASCVGAFVEMDGKQAPKEEGEMASRVLSSAALYRVTKASAR